MILVTPDCVSSLRRQDPLGVLFEFSQRTTRSIPFAECPCIITAWSSSMANKGKGFPSKRNRPYPEKYKPETGITEELRDKLCCRYQQLRGVLTWAVELGRVHIVYEVSSFNCSPRRGHLEAVYHIVAYLWGHLQSYDLTFDPIRPDAGNFLSRQSHTSISYISTMPQLTGSPSNSVLLRAQPLGVGAQPWELG